MRLKRYWFLCKNRGSLFNKGTDCGLDDRGLRPGRGIDFSLCHYIQPGCGAHGFLYIGYWRFFFSGRLRKLKYLECGTDLRPHILLRLNV